VADDGNDKPFNAQSSSVEAGRDVLFGWLVGRAAADFGLAQALAANEAQRAEQFRRLEEALRAQVNELREQPCTAAISTAQIEELNQLKTEMQSIFERMGGLESLATQFTPVPDLLRNEMAAWQSHLGERQKQVETDSSRFAKIADELDVKVRQLENQRNAKPEDVEHALNEFANCKLELRALAERIEQIELSAETVRPVTMQDIERGQALAADRIKSEFASFQADIFQRLREQPAESAIRTLKESLQEQADKLHRQSDQHGQSFAHLSADLAALRSQLQNLVQRVESATAIDFDAELARLRREVEDRIALGIGEFGDQVQSELRGVGEMKLDRAYFSAEKEAFVDRMAKIERVVEQTAAAIRSELNSVKGELGEQQIRQAPAEALLRSVEETVRTKIQEIQEHLAQEQKSIRSRDFQQRELEAQLERLAQRTQQMESMVQQVHAMVINETAQAAQQQGGFAAELAVLRTRVEDVQARDAVSHGPVETLTMKIQELQEQLAQQNANLTWRDTEIRDLKAQVQSLSQQMPRAAAGIAPSRAPIANRFQEVAPTPSDIRPREIPSESRLDSALQRFDAAAGGPHESREGDDTKEQILVEGGDPLKLMHARMSADIERARAELREKSGRWKVRG
jgi:chromosome segregation ATPase